MDKKQKGISHDDTKRKRSLREDYYEHLIHPRTSARWRWTKMTGTQMLPWQFVQT